MKQTYLFFYLKTGGGHLAPARSVAKYLEKNYPDKIKTILVDGLEKSPKMTKRFIEDGYRWSQNYFQKAYELLYAINKIRPLARLSQWVIGRDLLPHIEEQILSNSPAKIINFHFMLIRPISETIRKYGLDIPVITVVTDPYTAHPFWFLNKNQDFILFSPELKEFYTRKNVPENRMHVFPFILDEKFTDSPKAENTRELKAKHGFSPDKKLILLMGGGEGMPRGKSILKNLVSANLDAEIAVVCGRNEKLKVKAENIKSRYGFKNLKIYGFIDFVYELLAISDVVITKCGASTFMEILMSGKIPVINNYLWGQEKGNMEFITENRMGIYEKDISRLPEIVNKLISNENLYMEMKQNISNAALRNGTPRVSDFIYNFGERI